MTNEQNKVNKLLVKVKFNAYKLKESGSLPLFLFEDIAYLGIDSSIELVRCYMTLCEMYLRIKGFYFKYPELNEVYKAEVKKFLEERGFTR